MAAIYAIFEPNILGFQFFFSILTAEPTNRPPVRDYDPDTPLALADVCSVASSAYYLELRFGNLESKMLPEFESATRVIAIKFVAKEECIRHIFHSL